MLKSSATAHQVLKFLIGIHCEGYSRARVCRATGFSAATVTRALAKLVRDEAIARQRGGRATAAKLIALMSLEEYLSHQAKMSHQAPKMSRYVVQNEPLCGVLNLKEEKKKENRRPPQMETQSHHIPTDAELDEIAEREMRLIRARFEARYGQRAVGR